MSKITTVYDGLITLFGTNFPAKTRIPNAYSLPDNQKNFLTDGWGLKIGSSEPFDFEFCTRTTIRSFTFVVTREVFRMDADLQTMDDIIKEMSETINEAHRLINTPENMNLVGNVIKSDLSSVGGIEQIASEKMRFLAVEMEFKLTIMESI